MTAMDSINWFVLLLLTATSFLQADSAFNNSCSGSRVSYSAFSEADLYTRNTNFTSTTPVTILLQANITLLSPFMMDASFACTTIRSGTPGTPMTIRYPNDDAPAIFMLSTNDIFLYEVNVEHTVTQVSPSCLKRYHSLPDYNGDNVCAAIHMHNAYSIKVFQASILGRIDVIRSSRVHLDALSVFAPSYQFDLRTLGVRTPSVIRYLFCGDGVNLIRSNNILSNSEILGGYYGVLMFELTVGVVVKNNYFHNFTFTAIQCGQNVDNDADCMLSTFSHNYILTETWVPFNLDAAGIYFDTHWVNPGNYMSCNYIKGGRRCYYFDYVSSGIRVDGGACWNMLEGVKVNVGKNNKLSSILTYNMPYSAARITCINWFQNNCNYYPGTAWLAKYNRNYTTPAWQQVAPYLNDLCTATSVNGYACNPPNLGNVSIPAISGNCSGFPTNNVVDVILLDGSASNLPYYDQASCGGIPFIPKVNALSGSNFSASIVDDIANEDFGVSNPGSLLYTSHPNFKSCPKSTVGVQKKLYTPWWAAFLSTTFSTS